MPESIPESVEGLEDVIERTIVAPTMLGRAVTLEDVGNAAVFALSLAYSVIVAFTGSHEGYGMADPALWVFYVVGFGLVALAHTDKVWAWWIVATAVLALIAVGLFYYPAERADHLRLVRERRVHGALDPRRILCVQRLRSVSLAPGK